MSHSCLGGGMTLARTTSASWRLESIAAERGPKWSQNVSGAAVRSMIDPQVERGSVSDASEFYDVPSWGKGYFSISEEGHVLVPPTKALKRSIDLKRLVDGLELRGIDLPILIRFGDILKHRLGE